MNCRPPASPEPVFVLATRNPIEQERTCPLAPRRSRIAGRAHLRHDYGTAEAGYRATWEQLGCHPELS